jgi:hypothetical protein
MLPLLQFLKFLLTRTETRPDPDEAYLAQAVDVYDLERRMRDIDERGRNPLSGISLGLYPR